MHTVLINHSITRCSEFKQALSAIKKATVAEGIINLSKYNDLSPGGISSYLKEGFIQKFSDCKKFKIDKSIKENSTICGVVVYSQKDDEDEKIFLLEARGTLFITENGDIVYCDPKKENDTLVHVWEIKNK